MPTKVRKGSIRPMSTHKKYKAHRTHRSHRPYSSEFLINPATQAFPPRGSA